MTLRINRTHYPVTALGYGRRLGIWVQGCSLACPGCMAQDTWDESGGTTVSIEKLVRLWKTCAHHGADGITISGGEPLAQAPALAHLLSAIDQVRKDNTAEKSTTTTCDHDILLYTGYEETELDNNQREAIRLVDALITGRFTIQAPTPLIWRGSANQNLILRTPLGRRRYQHHIHDAPVNPPMQVSINDEGVWIIGVPRRDTLPTIERALVRCGITLSDVSWRVK